MTTTTTLHEQISRAERFHALHAPGAPLRLVNAWDAFSARVFANAGAPAIGTSSFAIALANGYQDGEHIPWSTVCDVAAAITDAVDLPVTVDIEAGHGVTPEAVRASVTDVLARGAVGINLEDSRPDQPGTLFDVAAQCARIAAARGVADEIAVPLFINARCDVWFGAAIAPDDQYDAALARATAYIDAGADGIFVPGLTDRTTLAQLVVAVTAPINVMHWPGLPPFAELVDTGVRRVSQGGSAFLYAAASLERMTQAFLGDEPDAFGGDLVPAFHLLPVLAYR
jgi:2-methylisocitrate lyase-like PEP mutase family enzyme